MFPAPVAECAIARQAGSALLLCTRKLGDAVVQLAELQVRSYEPAVKCECLPVSRDSVSDFAMPVFEGREFD